MRDIEFIEFKIHRKNLHVFIILANQLNVVYNLFYLKITGMVIDTPTNNLVCKHSDCCKPLKITV